MDGAWSLPPRRSPPTGIVRSNPEYGAVMATMDRQAMCWENVTASVNKRLEKPDEASQEKWYCACICKEKIRISTGEKGNKNKETTTEVHPGRRKSGCKITASVESLLAGKRIE